MFLMLKILDFSRCGSRKHFLRMTIILKSTREQFCCFYAILLWISAALH